MGAFVQHERKLSALAALREFFSVSPLWLRGATAFAGLLLCALIVFAVSRTWQQPVMTARDDDKKYTEAQFQEAVRKQVEQIAKSSEEKRELQGGTPNDDGPTANTICDASLAPENSAV